MLTVALLGDASTSIAEVAFFLGYAEPAPFHRSFKRWTGTTPQALLGRNRRHYDGLVGLTERLNRERQADTLLQCVVAVAAFASRHHPGRNSANASKPSA